MRLRALLIVTLLVVVAGLAVAWFRPHIPASTVDKPWPAPVQADEADKSVPLSPQDALANFTMPPGYQVQLVAAEPLVKDPILMEFDGDGRLWVVELPAFSINAQMENSFEPINDLVVLEDTDRDGVFDKRTVFMDKLVFPRAFKILDRNCALVGEPPNLWKACDTNGDLVSDTKELIADSFATKGVVEHGANGLYWGMDNTIYVSEHAWDVEYNDGKFRTRPSLRRGQWGVTQDNGGRIYRNVNTDPLFVDYVAPKYFVRNPNLVRTNGLYESLVRQEDTLIWPIHPTLGINRGYRRDIFRADQTSTYYGGVSSPLIYRGQSLPADVQNQPFVVDGPTNIVHLLKLANDNGKLTATDYYRPGEFLASTDVRFRPVALSGGWDGTIYIADMYRGISQDGPIQTDYLRDYNARRGLADGIHYGRIYRVVYKGMKVDDRPAMGKESAVALVAHLAHHNGWWRDTAQQLLVQRNDRTALPALEQLAADAGRPVPRLHALWTLDGMQALRPGLVLAALQDASPDVRAAALRLSERWLTTDSAMQAAVQARLDDPSWFVRRQLAATLGELPQASRLAAIVPVLRKYRDDTITVDAALSGLAGLEGEALAMLASDTEPAFDAIARLAGAASKGRDPATVRKLLASAGEAQYPTAVRVALLAGVAQGLRAASGNRGGGAVAGGRAGGAVPGVTRQRAVVTFALPSAPRPLLAMARGGDDLSKAAQEVLPLLDWPGKPPPPAVTPLTAEDQQRFAAGSATFQKVCVACHQADGTGIERIGATLVDSPWVNGSTDALIRILVNGKEGKVGLMPPLGAAMSDEEAAGVLTYVRRSFRNKGAPVLAAEVKETRQAYAHRATPWTDAELAVPRR